MSDVITFDQPIRGRPGAPLYILGNGHRSFALSDTSGPAFVFNRQSATEATSKQINVQMKRDAQGAHRIALDTTTDIVGLAVFEQHLNQILEQQLLELRCLPSSGYSLIHGLWSRHEGVTVDGICFNPSLARPVDLAPRKPMPQAFHNWLGERRTTFLRWLTEPPRNWSWPMIDGCDAKGAPATAVPTQKHIQHAQLLDALIRSAKSGTVRELEEVAQARIAPSNELLQASPQTIKLEQMFHLSRTQSDTPNWWLYDARASALIDQIAQHLRLAQFLAFSHTALKKVAPD